MRGRRHNRRLFTRLFICVSAVTLLLARGTATEMAAVAADPAAPGKLGGRLLVAAPGMRDPRFTKTVIFLVHHDDHGAMGLIVNRPIAVEKASTLLERMVGKKQPAGDDHEVRIHYGGPVRLSQGTFIHSSDYAGKGTVTVTDQVSVTANYDILRAIAKGKGPAKGFLAMGYAGWGPGQLENEIRRKDWVTVLPDNRIVFDDDMPSKWQRAMNKRSIDL